MPSDIRYALRRFRQRPLFFVASVVTLTLGIGFSTVVFNFLNFLLLRPLPVAEPEALVSLESAHAPNFSFPNYVDIERTNSVFTGVAAMRVMPMHVNVEGRKSRLWGYLVTGNYFELLGIEAFRGRLLSPSDDLSSGAHPVVVLSHSAWQRRFGADPGLVGSTIRINGYPFTVVGIAPPGFIGTERVLDSEIWVSFSMIREIEGRDWREYRRTHNAWCIGRLKPGVSHEQAEASLSVVARQLALEHPLENEGLEIHVAPAGLLASFLRRPILGVGGALLVLSALTLVVACANVSNLLLAQASDRRKEFALRLSLGATRGTLARMILAETLVLALAGCGAGLVASLWLARALVAWLPALDFPLNAELVTDVRVIAFAVVIALVSALLSSLWPALRGPALDPAPALKSEATLERFPRFDLRDLYVGVQVVVSIVLVSGSLMMVRTLQGALSSHYGFEPEGASALRFDLGMHGYSPERASQFQKRVVSEIRALPGIEAAGLANSIPFSIDQSWSTVYAEGKPVPPLAEAPTAVVYQTTSGLFRAMGTRLVAGRDLTEGDDESSVPVVVVNETLAERLFAGEDPLGKRIRFSATSDDAIEIVGVVEPGKYQTLTEDRQLALWRPLSQYPNTTSTLVARSRLPADETLALLRGTIERLDPELAVFDAKPLAEYLDTPSTPLRLTTASLTAMGGLAMVLCALGLNAILAYGTSRRTREIGIRMALGAGAADVLRIVLRRIALVVASSAAIGLALSFAVMRVLASFLFGVAEPEVYLASAAFMILVAAVACFLPARRALRLEPLSALRYD